MSWKTSLLGKVLRGRGGARQGTGVLDRVLRGGRRSTDTGRAQQPRLTGRAQRALLPESLVHHGTVEPHGGMIHDYFGLPEYQRNRMLTAESPKHISTYGRWGPGVPRRGFTKDLSPEDMKQLEDLWGDYIEFQIDRPALADHPGDMLDDVEEKIHSNFKEVAKRLWQENQDRRYRAFHRLGEFSKYRWPGADEGIEEWFQEADVLPKVK
jgi:hypothetical protein